MVATLINKENNSKSTNININDALIVAAEDGNKNLAEQLIKENVDIDHKTKNGETALIAAAINNNVCIAKILIENGASINLQDDDGQSALMEAAASKHNKDIVKLLVENKTDIDLQDNDGLTALMWAVIGGNDYAVKYLIDNGATIDTQDTEKNTALIFATMFSNEIAVKYLVDNSADIYLLNSSNFRAIDFAYKNKNIRKILISHGEKCEILNLNDTNNIDKIQKKYKEKLEKEHYFLHKSKYEFINFIKKYNNNNNKSEYINNIIYTYKNVINSQDSFGKTAIIYACEKGNLKLIENLIKHGADIEIEDYSGYNAWDYASRLNNKDKVISILKDYEIIVKTKNDPKRFVELLSSFTRDTPVKYTTHIWDFGNLKSEYDEFDGFVKKVNSYWKINIKDEVMKLSPSIHNEIEDFLQLWSKDNELKNWCNKGNDPFEKIGKNIKDFKNLIEIRSDSNALENIFFDIEEGLHSNHEIISKGLKGKQFYTDVQKFKIALKKIFHEIEKRDDNKNIEVIAKNETGEYIDIIITHIDSYAEASEKEMQQEIEDGDFADIKNLLHNLCDWSIKNCFEDKNYKINYLASDLSKKEIENIGTKPKGFTHILRFYK